MNVLAIIPARSGSKSIPDKNIKSLNGKPLMAYSIEHALASREITRVIISTDSSYYAEIAKKYGAEVPFLRPAEISQDLSNDIEFFHHALDWFFVNENFIPDICVQLRPTHPIRNPRDIDEMIKLLKSNPEADSVRSVVENKSYVPFKMWYLENNGTLQPVVNSNKIKEAYNQPRQNLPKTYFQNASIDVIRTSTITEKNSLSGDIILGYLMDEEFDIDYESDFEKAKIKLSQLDGENLEKSIKTYCFDIDGVIAHLSPNNDYVMSKPIKENIEKINRLFDAGNHIILFTARGYVTGIDWSSVTQSQLQNWGVKYHELKFGKPAADYYIDDRNLDISLL